VGLKFNVKLSEDGESAVSCACENGHDEVLEVLFELGACVNEAALPAAIRSGSFKCVERLLERKVNVTSRMLELAVACGHADLLGRLLRVCFGFGDAWLISWPDTFGDGQRILEEAGATPTWTASGVKLLMEKPGKAAEFAGIVPISATMVGNAGWKVEELQAVTARFLRDRRASPPVLRVLIQAEVPLSLAV
jgi:ankyrin repeat protein